MMCQRCGLTAAIDWRIVLCLACLRGVVQAEAAEREARLEEDLLDVWDDDEAEDWDVFAD